MGTPADKKEDLLKKVFYKDPNTGASLQLHSQGGVS